MSPLSHSLGFLNRLAELGAIVETGATRLDGGTDGGVRVLGLGLSALARAECHPFGQHIELERRAVHLLALHRNNSMVYKNY